VALSGVIETEKGINAQYAEWGHRMETMKALCERCGEEAVSEFVYNRYGERICLQCRANDVKATKPPPVKKKRKKKKKPVVDEPYYF
jgi:late competence protein required for DNA uptake (superfamily II DNA/RNA helicase)